MTQPQQELEQLLNKPDITDEEKWQSIQLMYDLAVPMALWDSWPNMARLEAHTRALLTANVSAGMRNVNLIALMTLYQLVQMLDEASACKLMKRVMAEECFDYHELMAEDEVHAGMRNVSAFMSTTIFQYAQTV